MNSIRNVLIANIIFILVGLTPLYPWLSNGLQKLSRPLFTLFVSGNQRFLGFGQLVFSLPSLSRENKNLKSQILERRVLEAEIKDLQKQNTLLRSQLNLASAGKQQKLFLSRVLGRQEKGDLVIIQGGFSQSIKTEDLVFVGRVLLGKVVEVSENQAKMRLTVSAESAWEVRSSDFLARGEVQGRFGNQLRLSKVLPSQTLAAGQALLEVGSGLLVGTVEKVEKEGAKIFKEAQVSAPYEPNLLDEVFILISN